VIWTWATPVPEPQIGGASRPLMSRGSSPISNVSQR